MGPRAAAPSVDLAARYRDVRVVLFTFTEEYHGRLTAAAIRELQRRSLEEGHFDPLRASYQYRVLEEHAESVGAMLAARDAARGVHVAAHEPASLDELSGRRRRPDARHVLEFDAALLDSLPARDFEDMCRAA